ncbi:MAG TPA: hypothetical protein VGP36_19685 [Mycobacteriales bacterium]|nr:hypothetical protein [Mycobacteriales bacterium]
MLVDPEDVPDDVAAVDDPDDDELDSDESEEDDDDDDSAFFADEPLSLSFADEDDPAGNFALSRLSLR